MLNPNFASKLYAYNHGFLTLENDPLEIEHDESTMASPFDELPKAGFTTSEINSIAEKIAEKLAKIVEQQLSAHIETKGS